MTKTDHAIKVKEFYFNNQVIQILLSADPNIDGYPDDLINKESQINMKAMLSDAKRNREYQCLSKIVTYTKKSYGDLHYGRFTSKGSIQNVWMRKAILSGRAIGFDIVNSQPSLVFGLTQKYIPDQAFPCLERCVKDRESVRSEIMKLYNCDKDEAKKLFIRIGFGGSTQEWEKDNKLEHKHSEFVKEYESEITKIKLELAPLYFPKYCDATTACKWKTENEKIPKHKKEENTQFALYLQNIEGDIMKICNHYFKENNQSVCAIVHDEIVIVDTLEIDNDGVVYALEKQVKNQLGHDIKFGWDKYETSPENKLLIERHKEYAPDQQFVEDYDIVKMKFELNCFKLTDTSTFAKQSGEKLIIQNKTNFTISFEDLHCMHLGKICQFMPIWYLDSSHRKYSRSDCLPPPQICPEGVYNTWAGFSAEKLESEPADFEPILEMMRSLCNYDEDVYSYFLDWTAQMVQSPGKKECIAIIFKGLAGCGKTSYYKVMRKVLGTHLVAESSNPSQDIFGSHGNSHIGKILCCFDEVKPKDTSGCLNRLKNIISSDVCVYNEKGLPQVEVQNNCRFIMTSNESVPINVEANDRRMCLIEPSDKYCGNHEHWDNFYGNVVENPAVIRGFYNHLVNLDISKRIFNNMPKTELRDEIIGGSLTRMVYWFYELVDNQCAEQKYIIKELFFLYREYMQSNGQSCNTNPNMFGIHLKDQILTPFAKFTNIKVEDIKKKSNGKVWLTVNQTDFLKWFASKGEMV